MGRYSTAMREPPPKKKEPHPIWRGIGCMIIILVPVLSYALAYVTLPMFSARRMVPSSLIKVAKLPDWMWQINRPLAGWLQGIIGEPGFLALVMLTILYIFVIGALLSVVYSYMHQMISPSAYGPLDAPPIRVKTKKYKR